MESQIPVHSARSVGFIGAGAWLLLAVAWQVSDFIEERSGWEGAATWAFFVGLIGLLVGGLAVAVMAWNRVNQPAHPRARIFGLGLLTAALVASFIAGWAVPLWTLAYGLALMVLAWSGGVARSVWVTGAGFASASIIWFALTALEVGAVDAYGDHPVAWQTAWWVAAFGGAVGLISWAKSLGSEPPVEAG